MIRPSKVDEVYSLIHGAKGEEEADAYMSLVRDKTFSATAIAREVRHFLAEFNVPLSLSESAVRRWRKSHGVL